MNTHWSFSASIPAALTAAAAWLACVWLGFLQWRRRGRSPRFAAIEAARLLAVTALCAAIFQPELVREIPHVEKPRVAILRDLSGSMQTPDAATARGGVQSRAEWLASTATPARWQPLRARSAVDIEDFGAVPGPDSDPGTDLNAALSGPLGRADNLKAIIVLTDGDWNLGASPTAAAARAAAGSIPIYTVGIGSETPLPDLILDHSDVPAYGILGDQLTIPFHITSHLPREVRSTLTLSSETGPAATKAVTIPAFGELADSVVWTPPEAGDFQLDLRLPVEPDEAIDTNNSQQFRVSIRPEQIKVLVVDSLPRWEYRYLRNALMRDPGIDVRTLLFLPGMQPGAGLDYLQAFPRDKAELSQYDVIFLGDVGIGDGELSADDAASIRAVVEQQAAGLVFIPGPRGRELSLASSPLDDLLPIDFDPAAPSGFGSSADAHLLLTPEGAGHLLTLLSADAAANAAIWKNLPGFHWCAAVADTRPGASVLAVHSTLRNPEGRLPLLVTRPFGNGKVLFMGTDAAWRWRLGVEDKYHYRFWGQVIRWMAHQRHLAQGRNIRLSYSPEAPRAGDSISLLAALFDDSGFPAASASLSANAVSPSGAAERLDFTPVSGGWGVFKAAYTPRSSGRFHLVLANTSGNQRLETDLNVAPSSREKVGDPANLAILREIAALTGGQFVSAAAGPAALDALVSRIALLPEPRPAQQRIPLWSQWYTAALLLLLFTIYWSARKLAGLP